MKISMNKKYTSGGDPIRILCVDRNHGRYPVIGLLDNGYTMYFEENGRYVYSDELYGNAYDLVEVWEPSVNEWCWFWDEGSHNAHLRKYSNMKGRHFISTDNCYWDHCSKFIGELPGHLSDE